MHFSSGLRAGWRVNMQSRHQNNLVDVACVQRSYTFKSVYSYLCICFYVFYNIVGCLDHLFLIAHHQESQSLLSFRYHYELWPPHAKSWLIGKDSDARRGWGQEEKGTTEDEMAGWHHWLDGCESQWTPGVGDGQGGLACCDSWDRKESDTTEQLNWTELNWWADEQNKRR